MKIYLVRDIETGLYSTGSISPSFRKEGKVWTARNRVSAHLIQFAANGMAKRYDTSKWEVVEYDLNNVAASETYNAHDYLRRRQSLLNLERKYGQAVSVLADKLDKDSATSTYRWGAIVIPDKSAIGESKTLPHFVRSLGIPSKNFRFASANGSTAFGFTSKDDLLVLKLAYSGKVEYLDLTTVTSILLTS